ncbi:hypothetical protein SESBI_49671 [Sesbania bispinosa]|nr:hypothetical protein SESBI_49671 [Sesbania bispinosa]
MSFSSPQVESRIQFTPLPQHVDQDQYNHHRQIVIEAHEERFDWDSIVIMLRLALVGTLLVGLCLTSRQLNHPNSDPIPPKFFLDTFHVPHLKVSDGELSSSWDLTLTISNIMNSSNINILRLDAAMCYKENETLALITPIMPQYALQNQVFPLEREETKRVHLKLNTTGWEKDQPIVEFGSGWVAPFVMYPKCTGLKVQFVAANQMKGEAAMMVDSKPRECVGLVEWGDVTDSL